jgi:hypothetical protein
MELDLRQLGAEIALGGDEQLQVRTSNPTW